MSKYTDPTTLKKLMKIIYQKQKQVDKYKKLLRQKQREKCKQKQNLLQNNKSLSKQALKIGLTSEQKFEITRQIIENKKFLQRASAKLSSMQSKIIQLQTDLAEQQNRNQLLEEQIYMIKLECQDKDKIINQLRTIKSLLENSKIVNNGQLTQKQRQIQHLVLQNQKIKIIHEQVKCQNLQFRDKLRNIQNQVNKQLKFIHKKMKYYFTTNKSQVEINFSSSRINKLSEKQIKTHTFILDKLEQTIEEKIRQTMELFKKWEQNLRIRQDQWRKNFDKALSDRSFGGISYLIADSMIKQQIQINNQQKAQQIQSKFYQTSVYKRNQEQLLKQLQRQCQKSEIGPISIQKQKLVQLSEVKQSLKMTKQVNEQLFEQLNNKQNIIKVFKQTFKSLQQKKLLKSQGNQYIQKLRSTLEPKN